MVMAIALFTGCSAGELEDLPNVVEADVQQDIVQIEQELMPIVSDDFIDMSIDLEKDMIMFHIDKESDPSYHYKIYYNDKEYKEYTKTDIDWGILYDYSLKDVTRVRIEAYVKQGEPEPFYSKTILIAIEPKSGEMDDVDLDIYYASRYDVDMNELIKYKDHLVNVTLSGNGIRGTMADLEGLENLERLHLQGCDNVTGSTNSLSELTLLNDTQIIECSNITVE